MIVTTRVRLDLGVWGPSRSGARLMGGRVYKRNSLCWWLSEDFGHWLTFEALFLPGAFASLVTGELLGHALFPADSDWHGKAAVIKGTKAMRQNKPCSPSCLCLP